MYISGTICSRSWISLQQTSPNPFAISLGDESGSHRLNLAGGINSFGTAIGPIVVSLALFGTAASANIDLDAMIENQEITLGSVQYLYIFVGILFLAAASIFIFQKIYKKKKKTQLFLGQTKQCLAFYLILSV